MSPHNPDKIKALDENNAALKTRCTSLRDQMKDDRVTEVSDQYWGISDLAGTQAIVHNLLLCPS